MEKEIKYTKEQATEVLKDYCDFNTSTWGSFEELFLEDKFPEELPEKGLLRHNNFEKVFVFRSGKESGYGFNISGEWQNLDYWTFEDHSKNWRGATKEDKSEWMELLKGHLVKLGFENGVKFNSISSGRDFTFKEGVEWNILSTEALVSGHGGCLMLKGVWAEPILETKEDIIKAIIRTKSKVEIDYLESLDLEYLKEYRRGFMDALKQVNGK